MYVLNILLGIRTLEMPHSGYSPQRKVSDWRPRLNQVVIFSDFQPLVLDITSLKEKVYCKRKVVIK
jgi:hypothetical protein